MENKFKVLKKWGDFKKGDIFEPEAEHYQGTQEDIDQLIEDGILVRERR